MLNNYGSYKATCLAKQKLNDKEKEVVLLVDANNEIDAKTKAEKQLKALKYNYFKIVSIDFIKKQPSTKNEINIQLKPKQKKTLIAVGTISFIFLVLIFVLIASGIIK